MFVGGGKLQYGLAVVYVAHLPVGRDAAHPALVGNAQVAVQLAALGRGKDALACGGVLVRHRPARAGLAAVAGDQAGFEDEGEVAFGQRRGVIVG